MPDRKKYLRGVSLIAAVFIMLALGMLGIVGASMLATHSGREWYSLKSSQAFYVAEGGSKEAINRLDILINTDLMNTVMNVNPQVLANNVQGYVNSGDGLALLFNYCKENGTAQFTLNGSQAIYNGASTNLGAGSYQYSVSVTENGNPYTVTTDVWDFPYNYVITVTGAVLDSLRQVISSGDFTVRVQRGNFARYALFDVHHNTPSGGKVWFNSRTNFTGPVHSNDRFRFYGNPSGTFDGAVTQHLTTAEFYNNGNSILADADSNPPIDVPIFNAGYTRGVNEINLESSVTQDDLRDQAQGGQGGSYPNGIYVNNSGGNVIGGIYVKGNSTVAMNKDAGNNATYTITQGSTTKIITVNYANNTTTVQTVGGSTNTYNGKPDGIDDLGTIIYADGAVNSLSGLVQKDSQVTISSQNDIIITNNITYEEYNTGPPPSATDKTNLLGILSWGGNVRIGAVAPNNINIHATVLARNGIFTVDDYNSKCYPNGCGIATLLGGAITDFYGAFGTFDPYTGLPRSGYGRNFVYDGRMAEGQAPPYFPSLRTFIAFTNDIADSVGWKEGGL